MAHVPDEFVRRRVEDAVQGNGQLDHAEVRADMAAGLGQPGDDFLPDFAGEVLKLRQREFLHVRRPVHHFEVCAHKVQDIFNHGWTRINTDKNS